VNIAAHRTVYLPAKSVQYSCEAKEIPTAQNRSRGDRSRDPWQLRLRKH